MYSVAIHLLAIAASRRGDREQAFAAFEESVEIGRRGGDAWLFSIALNNLGNELMVEGEYERAAELFEESLAIGEARGDLDRRARAYNNLGWATHRLGDLDRARDFYHRGLEAATEIGLVEGQLWALFGLAVVETETGDIRTGARLFGHTKELASRLGAAYEEADELERQTFARLEAALGPELLASELAAGLRCRSRTRSTSRSEGAISDLVELTSDAESVEVLRGFDSRRLHHQFALTQTQAADRPPGFSSTGSRQMSLRSGSGVWKELPDVDGHALQLDEFRELVERHLPAHGAGRVGGDARVFERQLGAASDLLELDSYFGDLGPIGIPVASARRRFPSGSVIALCRRGAGWRRSRDARR